jgi:hypothetical protein
VSQTQWVVDDVPLADEEAEDCEGCQRDNKQRPVQRPGYTPVPAHGAVAVGELLNRAKALYSQYIVLSTRMSVM